MKALKGVVLAECWSDGLNVQYINDGLNGPRPGIIFRRGWAESLKM